MRSGDISASIEVDGRPLNEYDVKTQRDGRTVTSFVPSAEGQQFLISYKNSSLRHHYQLDFFIDGRLVQRIYAQAGDRDTILGLQTEEAGVVRPFIFSRLALKEADDDAAGASGIDHSKIGTIEVYAWRAVEISRSTNRGPAIIRDVPEVGAVNERSKKLGGHCVAFGSGIRDKRVLGYSSATTKLLDAKDRPRCVLVFTYRPYDVLRAQGIVVPEPTRARRDEDSSQAAHRKPSRIDARGDAGPSKDTAKKRAATQPEQDNGSRPGPSKRPRKSDGMLATAEALHVKQESGSASGSDQSEDLEAQLDLVASSFQAQMAALREKIKHKKAKKAARSTNIKREPSPIRMPRNVSGAVVDLTYD